MDFIFDLESLSRVIEAHKHDAFTILVWTFSMPLPLNLIYKPDNNMLSGGNLECLKAELQWKGQKHSVVKADIVWMCGDTLASSYSKHLTKIQLNVGGTTRQHLRVFESYSQKRM